MLTLHALVSQEKEFLTYRDIGYLTWLFFFSNPSNTTIRNIYILPSASHSKINVFDFLIRFVVSVLVDNRNLPVRRFNCADLPDKCNRP